MNGPVYRALRSDLSAGRSVSRSEARRRLGPLAPVLLDGMVRRGVAERQGDLVLPRMRAASDALAGQIERRERQAIVDQARQQREADSRAAREAQAQRERQRRELMAAIDAAPTEEARRKVIGDGRLLVQGRELADWIEQHADAAPELGDLGDLFGIEIE